MRHEKVGPLEHLRQLGPDLAKGRSLPDVLPGEAVDLREHDARARRADQPGGASDDVIAFDAHEPEGARAVAAVVGGLEVERDEARARELRRLRTKASSSRHGPMLAARVAGVNPGRAARCGRPAARHI